MDVNYIREINAFYNELEIKPLSSSAIALWHALLHLNNRCGWKDSFSVPVGTLSLKSGLSDRSVLNARNELKTKGYLTFQSREGNRSAIYQLTRLSAKFADNVSDNLSYNLSDNVSDNLSDNLSILNKHKHKHKQNNITTTTTHAREDNVFETFEKEGFGTLSPILADRLNDLIDTYTERWVREAMKEAVLNGKRNIKYVEAILKRWKAEGIDSPWEKGGSKPKQTSTPTGPHVPGVEETRKYLEELEQLRLEKQRRLGRAANTS